MRYINLLTYLLTAVRIVFCGTVEKLKILSVLVNQLLTFASCRDYIDESAEKLKQIQRSLRAHQYAEIKRERDEAQFW